MKIKINGPIMEKQFYLEVAGGKLSCEAYGKANHSPVVVIHGGPGLGCHYLLPQMSQIEKFSYGIFYDQRGTGSSVCTLDWQANPFEAYSNDIHTIQKALGFEKITLLAHSFGGIFAGFYASAFPEQVDKIIYVNSVPLSSAEYLDYVAHRVSIVDENKSVLDSIRNSPAFLSGDPETVEQFYRIYFKNFFSNPDLMNQLSLTMTADAAVRNFDIYNFFYNYISNNPFDLRDTLKKLNLPSLIINAKNDVIPLRYLQQFHASSSNSTYIEIDHCGHFPYIEQPEILFQAIQSFLQTS
jgi:proline iminopeptidase